MKIIDNRVSTYQSNWGISHRSVVFDVPSSMRTITVENMCHEDAIFDVSPNNPPAYRYHLSLPKIRFLANLSKTEGEDGVELIQLFGVFLRDGKVCFPMMLPNISGLGKICLGGMKRYYVGDNLEVITDEIYSNFIQSNFTNIGEMINSFLQFANLRDSSLCLHAFYSDWSSRGSNYDICSNSRIESYRDDLKIKIRYDIECRFNQLFKEYMLIS